MVKRPALAGHCQAVIMSDREFVNITVVTFNRLDGTRRCIESVAHTADYPHVLTVVDNGSRDGTVEWLIRQKETGVIKNLILHPVNRGVAVAANDGWEAEDCRYYMKLDNDIVLQKPGWLRPMVRMLEALPQIGALAYNVEPVSYPLVSMDGFPVRIKNGNLGGCCILIPERTHTALGFWCEDYGLYGEEDTDYGLRILLAGHLNGYMEDESLARQLSGAEDPEYRRFKDGEHAHNWSGQSPFVENMVGYVKGTKSLYVPRSARKKPLPSANLRESSRMD